jgi:hypothetical protein
VVAAAFHATRDDLDLFLESCDRAIAEAESRDDTDEWVHAEWMRTWVLANLGRPAQAIEAAERFAARTAVLGSPSSAAFADALLGRAYAPVDPAKAMDHCRRALDTGRRGSHWAVIQDGWLTQLSLEANMSPAVDAANSAAALLRWGIETGALFAMTAQRTMRYAAMICGPEGDNETVLQIDGYLTGRMPIRANELDRFEESAAAAAQSHPDPEGARARGAALSQDEIVDRVLAALDRIATGPRPRGEVPRLAGDPQG